LRCLSRLGPSLLIGRKNKSKCRNKNPILLVEDDQVDAIIIKRAGKDAKMSNYLIIIEWRRGHGILE